MNKYIIIVISFFMVQSCIPLRIAPKIKDYKIIKGNKFKQSLPERNMFIFEDPKDANDFYNYVNTKFQLNYLNVYDDIPFTINHIQYFFSFYEINIPNKSLNLAPIAIDLVLEKNNMDPILNNIYTTRKGNWYIAIEIYNDIEQDCLNDSSSSKKAVSEYLKSLKEEYLALDNYNEVLFKNG